MCVYLIAINGSSREAATGVVLLKKDVLKSFPNFTGKHLCWSLFLMKVQV